MVGGVRNLNEPIQYLIELYIYLLVVLIEVIPSHKDTIEKKAESKDDLTFIQRLSSKQY